MVQSFTFYIVIVTKGGELTDTPLFDDKDIAMVIVNTNAEKLYSIRGST